MCITCATSWLHYRDTSVLRGLLTDWPTDIIYRPILLKIIHRGKYASIADVGLKCICLRGIGSNFKLGWLIMLHGQPKGGGGGGGGGQSAVAS